MANILRVALILTAAIAIWRVGSELALFERAVRVAIDRPDWPVDGLFAVVAVAGLLLPIHVALARGRRAHLHGKLRQAEARAAAERKVDALTSLPNRAAFSAALDHRTDKDVLPPTILLIELTGFRDINQNHGPRAADAVLIEVAQRIREQCEETDLPARIASAEFAVLLGPDRHQKSAERLARELVQRVGQPINVGARTLWLRANIGVSPGADRGAEDHALVCADRALSRARAEGPGQVRVYDGEIRAAAQREDRIRDSLVRSLEHDEVEPVFQPIVNLRTHRINGVEVLARWPKCRQGIGTFEYILAAERDGSISLLSDLLLAKACKTLATLDQDVWMSFNLSAQEFIDPDLPDRILSTLALYGIATNRFVIEITETAVMADLAMAKGVINVFRKAGVRIALDDFGTGASSLTLLAQLPLDRMKIDQTFVGHIEISESNAQIVTSMLVLAEGMGLSVVVEGIERPEEHDFLVARGCLYGQGYLYGRPCPADRLKHRLAIGPDYLRLLDKTG